MKPEEILHCVDHTLLRQTATWKDIKKLIDEGIKYSSASVCIPPSYVKEASEYAKSRIKICTVIGFPNGYSTTSSKCFEAEDAVRNGADEIDMVINLGWVKDKKFDLVLNEINEVKKSCGGKLLKVIVETCFLNEEEKIKMCSVVSSSSADFIKTSTGFGTAGAKVEDIELFSKYMTNGKLIKAAGGISGMADAEKFIAAGADRLGTSRVIKELENKNTD